MGSNKSIDGDKDLLDMSYDDFLEILKMEIGAFFRLAENGKVVRYQGLKARKHSMRVRKLLKLFRIASVAQDAKTQKMGIDDDAPEEDLTEEAESNTGYPDQDLF